MNDIRIGEMHPNFLYVIVESKTAKPIGFFGISALNELYGLYIDPEYRNKGYATQVLTLLRKEGIKLVVTTSEENIPMQHILEKLNYKKWLKYEDSE